LHYIQKCLVPIVVDDVYLISLIFNNGLRVINVLRASGKALKGRYMSAPGEARCFITNIAHSPERA